MRFVEKSNFRISLRRKSTQNELFIYALMSMSAHKSELTDKSLSRMMNEAEPSEEQLSHKQFC